MDLIFPWEQLVYVLMEKYIITSFSEFESILQKLQSAPLNTRISMCLFQTYVFGIELKSFQIMT